MKLNLKKIIGYKIFNDNNEIGSVKDILFDEKKWICRYFEIQLKNDKRRSGELMPYSFLWNEN